MFIKKAGTLLIIIFLSGCSSFTFQKIFGKKEKEADTVKAEKVNYGPTIPLVKSDGFVDMTKEYGLQGVRGVRFFSVDFNKDSYSDLVILPNYFSVPNFYKFDPKIKKFIKIKYNPFIQPIQMSYMQFVDLNNDGIKDLVTGALNQKSELRKKSLRVFRGRLKRGRVSYREVKFLGPKDLKIVQNLPLSSVSVLDFDLDGKLDLYLGTWFQYDQSGGTNIIPDRFLKGNKFKFFNYSPVLHREFEKTSKRSKIYPNATPTFSTSTCDIDQNGYPDVITTSTSGYRNKLWLNLYDQNRDVRNFRDYGESSQYAYDRDGADQLTGGGDSYFSNCIDYNNDGIMDLFIGELFHYYQDERVDKSSILTGKTKTFPPRFIRTAYTHDIENEWSQSDRRGIWLDYNNDGLVDLFVENSGYPPHTRAVLFRQYEDHSFENISDKLGIDISNPTGSISLDFNQDGKEDLLIGQSDIRDKDISPRVYLFENRMKRRGNRSIRFYLRGRRGNLDSIGSLVTLRTTKGRKVKWYNPSEGAQASQNEEGVFYGLRKGERPVYVKVEFPIKRGKTKTIRRFDLKNIKFKRFLNITLCENGRIFYKKKLNCSK